MSYRYLDHITWADTAFEARGATLEELFQDAALATLSVMIREPEALSQQETRVFEFSAQAKSPEQAVGELLHEYLQNLLFYKDADQLLLRPVKIEIARPGSENMPWHLKAQWAGEKIDFEKQELLTDVKAVTHHQFEVKNLDSEWVATVVLDV